jgi:hypothetical protein
MRLEPLPAEKQPQIHRLRLPKRTRQTLPRMTDQLFSGFQIQDTRSC